MTNTTEPEKRLWVLIDNATGQLTDGTHMAASFDPKALVLWLNPQAQAGDWTVTRCINGDLYESPCGRYCISEAMVFIPTNAQTEDSDK